MGRIAYAIYDRVRETAARAAMNEDDLLGFVMAQRRESVRLVNSFDDAK